MIVLLLDKIGLPSGRLAGVFRGLELDEDPDRSRSGGRSQIEGGGHQVCQYAVVGPTSDRVRCWGIFRSRAYGTAVHPTIMSTRHKERPLSKQN